MERLKPPNPQLQWRLFHLQSHKLSNLHPMTKVLLLFIILFQLLHNDVLVQKKKQVKGSLVAPSSGVTLSLPSGFVCWDKYLHCTN